MHAFNSSIQEVEACGYIERPCLHKRTGGLKVPKSAGSNPKSNVLKGVSVNLSAPDKVTSREASKQKH